MGQVDIEFKRQLSASLDKLFTGKSKAQSDQNLQLAQWLFTDAYKNQQMNVARMQELGLALPEEYKTANYADFLDTAGDSSTMSLLGNMYQQALSNDQLLNESITSYYRGKSAAEEVTRMGATRPQYYDYTTEEGEYTSYFEPEVLLTEWNQPPLEKYLLDPNEIKALAKKGDIKAEDYVDEIYMAGFKRGSRSEEDAMSMLQADIGLQNSLLALKKGKLDLSKQTNEENVSLIGSAVVNNMRDEGLPEVMGLKGSLERDGGMEYFSSLITNIKDEGLWPNIQNELISALESYATPGNEWDAHTGFVRMAGNAYNLVQFIEAKEKEAILMNMFGTVVDPLVGLSPDQIKLLRGTDEAYDSAYAKLEEYQSVGIPIVNPKLLQQAHMSTQISANIIDANNKLVSGELNNMSEELGISRDLLYQNIDWVPDDAYNSTVASVIAESSFQDAQIEDIDEVQELGDYISESEFKDILGTGSAAGKVFDKEQFMNKLLNPDNFIVETFRGNPRGALDPNSSIYKLIQSGKNDSMQKKEWKRLERALKYYSEIHRIATTTSVGATKEVYAQLNNAATDIGKILENIYPGGGPGLFGAKPFQRLFGDEY
jgi:hypothetical protein